MLPFGFFITSSGTENGKTFVTRGLSTYLFQSGVSVSAIKPIETGCNPLPLDAVSLARCCNKPLLAFHSGLFRSDQPLSPYASSIISDSPPPNIFSLSSIISHLASDSQVVLIESAGGLHVPLDSHSTTADFANFLHLPLLVVVRDVLGVLSHTLSLFDSASLFGLSISGLVLVRHEPGNVDRLPGSNFHILSERLSCPVFSFPFCQDNDGVLASAVKSSGLISLFSSVLSP